MHVHENIQQQLDLETGLWKNVFHYFPYFFNNICNILWYNKELDWTLPKAPRSFKAQNLASVRRACVISCKASGSHLS